MQLHSIVLTYIIHHLIERREIPPIHCLGKLHVKLFVPEKILPAVLAYCFFFLKNRKLYSIASKSSALPNKARRTYNPHPIIRVN